MTRSMFTSRLSALASPFILSAMLAWTSPAGLLAASAEPSRSLRPALAQPQDERPRIQLAILLDTSSSMDGLIDQARQQLWSAVNQFSTARRNGISPILEVAVYEYGNSRLSAEQGYTRQVIGLTRELDQVSEALFSLTTNGGLEYCGFAIAEAVKALQWSHSPDDVRAIFIAGNEPFSQGPVPYAEAIAAARAQSIVVNTIHAGDHQTGVGSGWQHGAVLAGGSYISIDHNQALVHIEAPQDQEIARLNASLNATYVPYGAEGAAGAARQLAQDSKTQEVSIGLLSQRVKAKSSSLYDNTGWDLVDAAEADPVLLESVAPAALPAPMQEMDTEERKAYVAEKAAERAAIQSRIADLAREREAYVADRRRAEAAGPVDTLEDALTGTVRRQAEAKRFSFNVE